MPTSTSAREYEIFVWSEYFRSNSGCNTCICTCILFMSICVCVTVFLLEHSRSTLLGALAAQSEHAGYQHFRSGLNTLHKIKENTKRFQQMQTYSFFLLASSLGHNEPTLIFASLLGWLLIMTLSSIFNDFLSMGWTSARAGYSGNWDLRLLKTKQKRNSEAATVKIVFLVVYYISL